MEGTPCEVCGKPGTVQGIPGAPASGCFCPDHAPHPVPPIFTILKAVLILAILGVAAWKLWRRFTGG